MNSALKSKLFRKAIIKSAFYEIASFLHLISQKKYAKITKKFHTILMDMLYRQQSNLHCDFSAIKNAISTRKLSILTPRTTEYNALALASVLKKHDYEVEIIFEYDSLANIGDKKLYFVLCPDAFPKGLPHYYFVYNFEQSICKRWFSDFYLLKIANSIAIMDYAKVNIDFFRQHDFPEDKIYYIPLTPAAPDEKLIQEKKIEAIFYGDANGARRKGPLARLQQTSGLRVIQNKYGDEMRQELNRSAIVVNIHNYENAILETTRICEAVSHGCLVISETSINDHEFPELAKLIDFVPDGNTDAMEKRLQYWLSNPEKLREKLSSNQQLLSHTNSDFTQNTEKLLRDYGLIR